VDKQPFDIEVVLARVRESIRGFADAAMFELAARGHTSLFEQLVACILSIRTLDEVSLPVALKLLSHARTPECGRWRSSAASCRRTRGCSACPVLSMCRQVGVRNPR
jgi:endonuclease III